MTSYRIGARERHLLWNTFLEGVEALWVTMNRGTIFHTEKCEILIAIFKCKKATFLPELQVSQLLPKLRLKLLIMI